MEVCLCYNFQFQILHLHNISKIKLIIKTIRAHTPSIKQHRAIFFGSQADRGTIIASGRRSSRSHDSGDKNKAARLRGASLIKYGATPAAAVELKLQAVR